MLKLDHLGIAVKNIAEARSFYESLGLTILSEEVVEQEGVRAALIPIGDSRIELLEPLGEHTPVARFLAKRGEGLHHLAFHVEDISLAFEQMKQSGARLLSDRDSGRRRRPSLFLRSSGERRGSVGRDLPDPILEA